MDWIERGIWYFYAGALFAEIVTRFGTRRSALIYLLTLFTWPLLIPASIVFYEIQRGKK
jgi:hypothetical protein